MPIALVQQDVVHIGGGGHSDQLLAVEVQVSGSAECQLHTDVNVIDRNIR